MTKAWERLEAGKGFNQRLDPPYYDMVDTNWEMFKGNQYVNSGTDDGLPRPVFNIIKRIITFFVASLTTAPSKIYFSQLAKKPGSNVDEIDMLVLNAEMEAFCERIKLDSKVRDMYKDAAITGDFALHLYMDADKKPYGGAFSDIIGEICCDVVDGTNVYFGNPNNIDTQAQPYILVTGRDMVADLQAEYNEFQKDKQDLTADNDNEYQAGNDAKIEIETLDGTGKATYVLMYEKKKQKDGSTKVFVSKSIKDVVIYDNVDTGLSLYPVIFGNWERQKNNYHGLALCTTIIPNQIFINRMFAMAMKNLMDTAFPKAIYDKNRLSGWSNRVGVAIPVENMAPGENISNVARYLEPGTMSPQIIQMINLAWDYTKESLGGNDAMMGSVNPEMASGAAISVTAKQAAVPLTTPKNNMYDALESLGNIFLDMVVNSYGERPVIMDKDNEMDEQEKTVVMYDFAKLKDVYLSTKVDVGAITPYDEMADRMTYENFLKEGLITFEEFIEAYPDLFKNKDKILQRIASTEAMAQQPEIPVQGDQVDPEQQMYEEMFASMSEEQQQVFMQLSPDEQEQLVAEYQAQ